MWLSGERSGGWPGPGRGSTGWAHSEQNFAAGESGLPQREQMSASGAAHSSQYFAVGRFSCPQREHVIADSPATGAVVVAA
jgi:hypothetical protein